MPVIFIPVIIKRYLFDMSEIVYNVVSSGICTKLHLSESNIYQFDISSLKSDLLPLPARSKVPIGRRSFGHYRLNKRFIELYSFKF